MHVLNTQSLITKNKMFILSSSFMGNCSNYLQLGQYHLLDFGGTELQEGKMKPPLILNSCCRSQPLISAKLFAGIR